MAQTPKIKRRWIREEKQIVYLLYRKGLLKDFKIKDLYWAEYYMTSKCYKSECGKYSHTVYMPEVHFSTSDYWGESDEHGIVDDVLQNLHWANIDTTNWSEDTGEYPPSTFPRMTRGEFIKYLKKLPTLVPDRKINQVLKTIYIDY